MIQNISEKDLRILSALRENARMSLTKMSRKTQIPVSTIHDRLKSYKENLVTKYTSLLDFGALGFMTKVHIMFKINKEQKESIKEFLVKHHNVNSVFKINNGYDYLVEAIFKTLKDMEEFIEVLESKFTIKGKEYYFIIDDIKREAFFNDADVMMLLTP